MLQHTLFKLKVVNPLEMYFLIFLYVIFICYLTVYTLTAVVELLKIPYRYIFRKRLRRLEKEEELRMRQEMENMEKLIKDQEMANIERLMKEEAAEAAKKPRKKRVMKKKPNAPRKRKR